jgi:hypothetical protein
MTSGRTRIKARIWAYYSRRCYPAKHDPGLGFGFFD